MDVHEFGEEAEFFRDIVVVDCHGTKVRQNGSLRYVPRPAWVCAGGLNAKVPDLSGQGRL